MIGDSFYEYIFIRACIFLLQYTTPLCILGLTVLLIAGGPPVLAWPISGGLIAYSVVDILYALFVWIPYNRRLRDEARHPPPLSSEQRWSLFVKTLDHVPNFDRYLRLWFLGADQNDIQRDNVRDFILWAFFDRTPDSAAFEDLREVDRYVDAIEEKRGMKLEPGRGNTPSFRLTFDPVETRYRSFIWFILIGLVDFITHCQFLWNGFQYYAQPKAKFLSVIPLRVQTLFARRRSKSAELSYWHRPHTATDKLPVVFVHGIGIGLWTYGPFLSQLNGSSDDGGQIGIIAVELLPISFRLTSSPLTKLEFLRQLGIILESHGWGDFVLATHSYGSVLASHMVRSPEFGPRIKAAVLVDPVSIMLHQPDVAYNFTRRKPRRANEWQLWYFASMDPGVAHALGRHFFWNENVIWKEELLALPQQLTAQESREPRGSATPENQATRALAICLSERDLIVDTMTVAQYLADGESWVPGRGGGGDETGHSEPDRSSNYFLTGDGIEILWFPGLDHAQAFDTPADQERICKVLRRYCKV
ncbi:uncharacterized protein JN550_011874 [Neoarthrinium moseri]|uniref:uncharacterized protein n=1 Tax=Neoarthrinium moseri TaxID=1658444 RepID=UPI001FDB60CC|nr:uncharacterized protein JN550_011874 [Neoarthrinium moseri]KAI1859679.1 hypothetical protein JN550_011874 [Neoarthrinium moseri]